MRFRFASNSTWLSLMPLLALGLPDTVCLCFGEGNILRSATLLFFFFFLFFFSYLFIYLFIYFATLATCGSSWAWDWSEMQLRSIPQPQQQWICTTSETSAAACGNTGSLTHWSRPGYNPHPLRDNVLTPWATTRTPQGKFLKGLMDRYGVENPAP